MDYRKEAGSIANGYMELFSYKGEWNWGGMKKRWP